MRYFLVVLMFVTLYPANAMAEWCTTIQFTGGLLFPETRTSNVRRVPDGVEVSGAAAVKVKPVFFGYNIAVGGVMNHPVVVSGPTEWYTDRFGMYNETLEVCYLLGEPFPAQKQVQMTYELSHPRFEVTSGSGEHITVLGSTSDFAGWIKTYDYVPVADPQHIWVHQSTWDAHNYIELENEISLDCNVSVGCNDQVEVTVGPSLSPEPGCLGKSGCVPGVHGNLLWVSGSKDSVATYHEFGHVVHDRLWEGSLPPSNGGASVTEGFAELIAFFVQGVFLSPELSTLETNWTCGTPVSDPDGSTAGKLRRTTRDLLDHSPGETSASQGSPGVDRISWDVRSFLIVIAAMTPAQSQAFNTHVLLDVISNTFNNANLDTALIDLGALNCVTFP